MKLSSISSERRALARLLPWFAAVVAIALAGAFLGQDDKPVAPLSVQRKETPALTIPTQISQEYPEQQVGAQATIPLPPLPPSLQGTDAPKIELDGDRKSVV